MFKVQTPGATAAPGSFAIEDWEVLDARDQIQAHDAATAAMPVTLEALPGALRQALKAEDTQQTAVLLDAFRRWTDTPDADPRQHFALLLDAMTGTDLGPANPAARLYIDALASMKTVALNHRHPFSRRKTWPCPMAQGALNRSRPFWLKDNAQTWAPLDAESLGRWLSRVEAFARAGLIDGTQCLAMLRAASPTPLPYLAMFRGDAAGGTFQTVIDGIRKVGLAAGLKGSALVELMQARSDAGTLLGAACRLSQPGPLRAVLLTAHAARDRGALSAAEHLRLISEAGKSSDSRKTSSVLEELCAGDRPETLRTYLNELQSAAHADLITADALFKLLRVTGPDGTPAIARSAPTQAWLLFQAIREAEQDDLLSPAHSSSLLRWLPDSAMRRDLMLDRTKPIPAPPEEAAAEAKVEVEVEVEAKVEVEVEVEVEVRVERVTDVDLASDSDWDSYSYSDSDWDSDSDSDSDSEPLQFPDSPPPLAERKEMAVKSGQLFGRI